MSRKKSLTGFFPGLSGRLKEIRGGLTQAEFGKIIGVNQGTIWKYENGRVPDVETLKKIANHGGVTVEWLLKGEEKGTPAQTAEHAPETYEARPAYLDKDALEKIILLTRDFLRRHSDNISAAGEADLIARNYEYWLDNFKYPDDQVIAAHRRLVK